MLKTPPRIELLNDLTSIDDETWDRVLDRSPTQTIFQTRAWQLAWWETFGRGKLLQVAVYEDGQLTTLAPLFADQGMVFFVGSGGSDYLDFIGDCAQPDTLLSILELARAETPGFVGFRFYHVPDQSPTARTLASIASQLELTHHDEGALLAPALRFQDWPADKRLPSEKKSLIRHERSIAKLGRLEVNHFSQASEVEPLLSSFFDQHVGRWAETPAPSLFLEERQRQFYSRFIHGIGSRGWLRFTRVSLDDQPIAFHLGFLFGGSFLWYKPTFDINHASLSPGEVLLRSLLQQAQAEQAQVFDFGLGDEPFKQRFLTETSQVRTWGLYPMPPIPPRRESVD